MQRATEIWTKNFDCEYVALECPKKCVQRVQKRNVDTHLANECPNRDYRCPHCSFASAFCVVSKHFDVCRYYPLACPNRCGVTFERDDLDDHMKMCRLEEVECVFAKAGCQANFIRENEDAHMDQNMQKHLALMPAATLKISQDFEQKLQEQLEAFEKKLDQKDEQIKQVEQKLDKQSREFQEQLGEQQNEFQEQLGKQQNEFQELTKEKDAQIKGLEEQQIRNRQLIEKQQQTISQICSGEVGIPPYDITLSNYQQEKTRNVNIEGPPMYTHPGGYKFNLRLFPNGRGIGAGTHVTVCVFSLKSDDDATLKVPVKFTITLHLLNQHRDQDHHTRDIQCEIKNRETIGSVWNAAAVDWKFIPHADLKWNRDKQTQYLKDDCLKFRITKIIVH